ncbi:MAG: caspase family protein [Pseudomonadota bacterium]
MARHPLSRLAVALLASTFVPAFAVAQEAAEAGRSALIIGNERYEDQRLDGVGADAIAMSQTLFGLGFDVTRWEDATASDLSAARTDQVLRGETIVLYLAGRITGLDGLITLAPSDEGDPLDITSLIERTRAGGAQQIFAILDVCAETGTAETPPALPSAPGLFEIRPTSPGTACPMEKADARPFLETVLSQILKQGTDVEESFSPDALEESGVWAVSHLTAPFFFRKTVGTERSLTSNDLDMLAGLTPAKRDQMMQVWRRGGLLGGSREPATTGAVAATRVQPVISDRVTTAAASRQVFVTPAAPSAARTARQTREGLPEPSIIVGIITPTPAAFTPEEVLEESAEITSQEITGDNLAALRAEDPVLLASLIEAGAFDPAPRDLPRAIQVELARMGCYTARIDGLWGRGSRAAVQRYYTEVGENPPTLDAAIPVFRDVAKADNVTCPAPAPVARVQPRQDPAPSTPATRRVATPAPTPEPEPTVAAPQPQPEPQQPAQGGSRRISNTGLGIGTSR